MTTSLETPLEALSVPVTEPEVAALLEAIPRTGECSSLRMVVQRLAFQRDLTRDTIVQQEQTIAELAESCHYMRSLIREVVRGPAAEFAITSSDAALRRAGRE